MHDDGLLELSLIFLLAAVLAVPIFKRFGLGAVLGYLVAGVAIGPSAFALIKDPDSVLAVSELGVVMLLFVIGLELSPARLWVMRKPVFGIGGLQVLIGALVLGGILSLMELGWKASVIMGVALALSSTAVGLQILAERKELHADFGRTAFAILLFQDIVAIPLLASIPLLGAAKAADLATPPWEAIFKAVLMIGLVIFAGRYLLRYVFRMVAKAASTELFTATALLVVAGNAWLMQQGGLSLGLGAFLAGVLLADSEFRHELESHIEPFKGLLLGMFFMAVGMGLDLNIIAEEPAYLIGATLAFLTIKALLFFAVGRLSGLRARASLMLAAVLSLGGEFAFVVFSEAHKYQLIDTLLRDQVTVVVGLSMACTPLLVLLASRWLEQHPDPQKERAYDKIENEYPRVIIAGFGRMGQIIGRMLRAKGIPFTALENSAEQVDFSRRFGNKIYYGDPARPELLRAAQAQHAEIFVLATDDPEANIRTARVVKRLFPHLKVIARARNRQHAWRLMDLHVDSVVRETLLGSIEMGRQVLEAMGVPPERARMRAERFLQHDEKLLHEQYLIFDDEAALVASSKQAQHDLLRLFEADASDEDNEDETEGDSPAR